jgi:cell division protein FtsL
VVVAALLGGIVTVQVAALRANIELGRLNDQAAQLRTENQNAAAEIAVLENGARIERFARKRGMTLVVPAAGDVLTLAAPHRRAAARHHAASGPPPSRGRRPPR